MILELLLTLFLPDKKKSNFAINLVTSSPRKTEHLTSCDDSDIDISLEAMENMPMISSTDS